MLESLGFGEVLLVLTLGLLLFTPRDMLVFWQRSLVWKTRLESWAKGMARGFWGEGKDDKPT